MKSGKMGIEVLLLNSSEDLKERFETDGYSWEEVSAQLKKIECLENYSDIEQKLLNLAGNVDEHYNYLKGLIDQEQSSCGFSDLSLESLIEQANHGIAGAAEALENKKNALVDKADAKLKSSINGMLEGSWVGKIAKWFGFDTAGWVIDNGKKYLTSGEENETSGGFGKMVFGGILSVMGLGGASKVFENFSSTITSMQESVTGFFDGDGDPTSAGDHPKKNPDSPEASNVSEESNDSKESEKILSASRDALRSAGYRALGKISGLETEGYESEIMGALDAKDFTLQSLEYKLQNSSNKDDLKKIYGLNESEFSNEEIGKVVMSLIGPYNKEFFQYQLTPEKIKNMIGVKPGYTKLAKKYFSSTELDDIDDAKYDYSAIQIGLLSRLCIMSLGEYVSIAKNMTGEFTEKIKSFFGDMLTDKELLTDFESKTKKIPENVTQVFSDILSSSLDSDVTVSDLEQKAKGKDVKITTEDEAFLKDFVGFNKSFRNELDQYNFGLEDFSQDISDNLTYGRLLSLYAITGGESLSSVDGFGKVLLYTWMHQSLSSVKQGRYEAAIIKALAEDDNTDSRVLEAFVFQVLEVERSAFHHLVEKTKGRIDGGTDAVLSLIPEYEKIENQWLKELIIGATQVGGGTLFLKLLTRMPTTRAVIIATSGVLASIIYFGIAEGLHNKTQNKIGTTYKDFITEISPKIGYENSESLVAKIESGDLNVADIYSKINDLGEEYSVELLKKVADVM